MVAAGSLKARLLLQVRVSAAVLRKMKMIKQQLEVGVSPLPAANSF